MLLNNQLFSQSSRPIKDGNTSRLKQGFTLTELPAVMELRSRSTQPQHPWFDRRPAEDIYTG